MGAGVCYCWRVPVLAWFKGKPQEKLGTTACFLAEVVPLISGGKKQTRPFFGGRCPVSPRSKRRQPVQRWVCASNVRKHVTGMVPFCLARVSRCVSCVLGHKCTHIRMQFYKHKNFAANNAHNFDVLRNMS